MTAAETITREPLTSVLVPTDFSGGADRALGRALKLPLAPGARVHVVHVMPVAYSGESQPPDALRAEIGHHLQETLSRARSTDGADTIGLTSELLSGRAFVEIIRCARRVGAELIVLGRHGRRRFRDMLIGTTAERVIRKGDVPVLVVNREPTETYRRPLIATDLEDGSRRTFELAFRVIDPVVTEVSVVHAFDAPFEGYSSPMFASGKKNHYQRVSRERATASLAEYLAPYNAAGVGWNTYLRQGDPRAVVLGAAGRREADLLAVGTHGRSGISHALVGSVAERVIRAATCDVLVARSVPLSFELP